MRRGTVVLFAGVALGTTTFFSASSVAPVIGEELSGSASWSGVPGAAGLLGVGVGATVISRVMARRGRRPGLVLGYTMAFLGAAVCLLAVRGGFFGVFLAGMFVMGWGHSANQLARYAAADLHPPDRRAMGLALVVWAATVGAISGPNLLDAFGGIAGRLDLPALAGPYLVGAVLLAAASVTIFAGLRPDPASLTAPVDPSEEDPVPLVRPWRHPPVQVALAALVGSQAVMVLVMSMTPLHMSEDGHSLSSIGVVMSAHFVGMYGLSPVAGRLTDRLGKQPVVTGGLTLLLASAVLAGSGLLSGTTLLLPLFFLGLGWSMSFVASSALLTEGMPFAVRARLQGTADTLAWSSAALTSGVAGVILDRAGFETLALVAAGIIACPLVFVLLRATATVASPAAP